MNPAANTAELSPHQTRVALAPIENREYSVVVGADLLQTIGEECATVLNPTKTQLLLLTDTYLGERYGGTAQASLQAAGFRVTTLIVPAGETTKSLTQAQVIFETLSQQEFSRNDAIVALGGGVIGDLAGFCAATYHRGIAVIQVPTTLVAQVDSAIGGKTAVNLGTLKNIVGTFYQPKRVIADTDLLQTLPPREFAAGMAEVIKYGLIESSCTGENTGLFGRLLEHAEANTLHSVLPEIIHRSIAIKAAVVMKDEFETLGLRYFLNLGHTFGHAYESLSDFDLLHGEAVAIGLEKAVRLAVKLNQFPKPILSDLHRLLRACGLGDALDKAPAFDSDALLAVMRQDKKNQRGLIRLILPTESVGRVVVRDDIQTEAILWAFSQPTITPE